MTKVINYHRKPNTAAEYLQMSDELLNDFLFTDAQLLDQRNNERVYNAFLRLKTELTSLAKREEIARKNVFGEGLKRIKV